jgi:serine/threonine protein kinase
MVATMRIPALPPPDPPEGLSDLFKDFLRRMLLRHPAGRARAAQLIEHPLAASADQWDSQVRSPLSRPSKRKRKQRRKRRPKKKRRKNEGAAAMARTPRHPVHLQADQRTKRFLLFAWTENDGDEWPGPN